MLAAESLRDIPSWLLSADTGSAPRRGAPARTSGRVLPRSFRGNPRQIAENFAERAAKIAERAARGRREGHVKFRRGRQSFFLTYYIRYEYIITVEAITESKESAMPSLTEARKGIYPAPVYEAVLSTGEHIRMSFFSRVGKPINFAAGRAAVEATSAVLDYSREPIWIRENGVMYCRHFRRPDVAIVSGHVDLATVTSRSETMIEAYQRRAKVGGVYSEPCPPLGSVSVKSVTRIEDDTLSVIAMPKRKATSWRVIAKQAREALRAGDHGAALKLLEAA